MIDDFILWTIRRRKSDKRSDIWRPKKLSKYLYQNFGNEQGVKISKWMTESSHI